MLYLAKRILKNPNKNIEEERKAIKLLKEASRKNVSLNFISIKAVNLTW